MAYRDLLDRDVQEKSFYLSYCAITFRTTVWQAVTFNMRRIGGKITNVVLNHNVSYVWNG